ncbi:hypothetical protein ACLK1T_06970 [Escherichia coli]
MPLHALAMLKNAVKVLSQTARCCWPNRTD